MVSPANVNDHGGIPPIRREGVVVEELDGEALVYDPECGAVHRFNGVVMFLWSCCDGIRATGDLADEMAEYYAIDRAEAEQQVRQVIADLHRLGLLHDGPMDGREPERAGMCDAKQNQSNHPDGLSLSRRRLIRGGVGMVVFAPPAISTFFARGAHAAYSPNPINPGFSPTCDSGLANPGYSCTASDDCCGGASDTKCEGGACCVKQNRTTCIQDSDCCAGLTCSGDTCVN